MKKLILILLLFMVGCALNPTDKLLSDVGYKFKTIPNCQERAEAQVAYLQDQGIKAEVVGCEARSKYSWDHAIAKAYIDGEWWVVPDGLIMDIPWEYNEVKKACYDFILP